MISEIKPGLENIVLEALVESVTQGKTNGNNKTNYLSINLQDRSGMLMSKLWNATNEQLDTIQVGCVCRIKGDTIKYNDECQLKITSLEIISQEPSVQELYLKSAPVEKEILNQNLLLFIQDIKNPKIHAIVESLYMDYQERFLSYPAASKNHHEYVSGLAYHSYSMLKLAKAICELYPETNADLLYAGIFLHDIGKIIELSGPVIPEYTLEGKLLGHISIGNTMIKSKAEQLHIEGEEVTLLQHMILSHHGKNEFGSPVLPQIMEAEIAHLIDDLDSKIEMLNKALNGVEKGNYTKRIFALDKRMFYKPNID